MARKDPYYPASTVASAIPPDYDVFVKVRGGNRLAGALVQIDLLASDADTITDAALDGTALFGSVVPPTAGAVAGTDPGRFGIMLAATLDDAIGPCRLRGEVNALILKAAGDVTPGMELAANTNGYLKAASADGARVLAIALGTVVAPSSATLARVVFDGEVGFGLEGTSTVQAQILANIANDGERSGAKSLASNDTRIDSIVTGPTNIVRSPLPGTATTFGVLTSGVAYAVYLGQWLNTNKLLLRLKMFNILSGSVSSVGEVGIYTSPLAPDAGSGQTLTKVGAAAISTDMTALGGKSLIEDISGFAAPAYRAHIWGVIRVECGGTQPSFTALGPDMDQGCAMQLAASGALTALDTGAFLIPTAAALSSPDIMLVVSDP